MCIVVIRSFSFQVKGPTNVMFVEKPLNISTTLLNTSVCIVAKNHSNAKNASKGFLTQDPTVNTWITVSATANLTMSDSPRTSFLFRLSSPKSCSFDCPVYLHIYYIYLLRIVLEPRGFVKGELKFMKEVPKEMFTVIIVTFRTYILCWIIISKSVERCICERSMDVRRGARLPKFLKIVSLEYQPRDIGADRKKSRQGQNLGTIMPVVYCLVRLFEKQNITVK